ncbi:DUF1569 domain-containing protein [bacterium]|nr:DUF1569 domain-containing protein [bacterium]
MPTIEPLKMDSQDAYKQRIVTIPYNRQPRWGRMNVAEMFHHNTRYMEIPLETRTVKDRSNWLFRLIVKPLILSRMTFPKNVATIPELRVADLREVEEERKQLLIRVEEFTERVNTDPGKEVPNPLLGPLTLEQWSILAGKHLNHHLRQFGA